MQASQNKNNEQMLTSDGIPLKKKLSKALFRSRLRAFGLVTPLLLLISIGFVFFLIPTEAEFTIIPFGVGSKCGLVSKWRASWLHVLLVPSIRPNSYGPHAREQATDRRRA